MPHAPPVSIRFVGFLALVSLLLFAGCGESGDKAIAYGAGLGLDWKAPAGPKQMRISVKNSFTRDVWIECDAPGLHYELTVGPIRKRYMIVPEAKYEIKTFTKDSSAGINKLYITDDDRNSSRGLLVKIRY